MAGDRQDDGRALADAVDHIRSDDQRRQNEGVEVAVGQGAAAVPALLPLLEDARNDVRAQAAYALSEIGDSAGSDALFLRLEDDDERVRAFAGAGLAAARDPRALDACLQTLDDAADELHNDITPAVGALAAIGLPAVPRLLNVMVDGERVSRLHAQRALERIASSFVSRSEVGLRALWRRNGGYDFDLDPATRRIAADRWRAWHDEMIGRSS